MHRKVAAALVAALALGVASCGGTETTTVSKAQLVRRVEAACREGQAVSQRAARSARRDGSLGFVSAIQAGQEVVLDRLEGMTTSGAARANYEALRDALQRRLDLIKRVTSADRADQQRMVRAVQADAEVASRKAEEAARRLGIEGCS